MINNQLIDINNSKNTNQDFPFSPEIPIIVTSLIIIFGLICDYLIKMDDYLNNNEKTIENDREIFGISSEQEDAFEKTKEIINNFERKFKDNFQEIEITPGLTQDQNKIFVNHKALVETLILTLIETVKKQEENLVEKLNAEVQNFKLEWINNNEDLTRIICDKSKEQIDSDNDLEHDIAALPTYSSEQLFEYSKNLNAKIEELASYSDSDDVNVINNNRILVEGLISEFFIEINNIFNKNDEENESTERKSGSLRY